jgi:signal peptidase I
VKRIVAEPGDTIKIVDGRVLRNDVPLADDFIPEKYRDHDNLGPFVLPRGYYYVMGDHRNNSSDSRTGATCRSGTSSARCSCAGGRSTARRFSESGF